MGKYIRKHAKNGNPGKILSLLLILGGSTLILGSFFERDKPVDEVTGFSQESMVETTVEMMPSSRMALPAVIESSEALEESSEETKGATYLEEILETRGSEARADETPWNRVDISFGGHRQDSGSAWQDENRVLQTEEPSIGKIEVPKVGIDKDFYQGIGLAENGVLSDGNSLRMVAPVTWRLDQVLGGDNYILLSHVDSYGDVTKWFTPLLASKSNPAESTRDLNDLLLQKGDQIIITEYGENIIWKFEIDSFGQTTTETSEEQLAEAKQFLDRSPGEPRITLQGCLYDTGQKFFISGKLVEVKRGDETLRVE